MVDIYITDQKTRNLNKIEKPVKGCWINMVSPTDNEIRKISSKLWRKYNYENKTTKSNKRIFK